MREDVPVKKNRRVERILKSYMRGVDKRRKKKYLAREKAKIQQEISENGTFQQRVYFTINGRMPSIYTTDGEVPYDFYINHAYLPRIGEQVSFRYTDSPSSREFFRVVNVIHIFGPSLTLDGMERTYIELEPIGETKRYVDNIKYGRIQNGCKPWWEDEHDSLPVPWDDLNLIRGI